MKEYVSLTTAAMKMGKTHFYSDHSNSCKEEKMLYRVTHAKSSKVCHPYLVDVLEISTSGRYHRDLKILEILASNSKWFRVYGIFRKLQIDDEGGDHQIQQFLR